ncbi:surface antigen D15 domain-containing protein [Calothrix sp. NIES-4071]|nr:surface antigen D15 domain-containing protein [Calothrix sp. NIES-4071]BAZ54524.1 surface antigen D15 domain-containing protein [Calothrix sp. NIES-4105]
MKALKYTIKNGVKIVQWSKYLPDRFAICIKKLSVILLGCIGAGATTLENPTFGQNTNIPPGINIPPTIRERVEETIPKPTQPIIPTPTPSPSPTPLLQTPSTPQPIPNATPNLRFYVKKIEVRGNTVLKDEINKLVKQYENRQVTFEELISLRSAITELYFKNGYVTSGAFVPNNQALDSGIVQIQVVEGELERIEINGLTRLQKAYVLRRLGNATKPPLNRQRLESGLQLLQLDPLLERVNAELTAGSTSGRNILRVDLQEAPAFHAGIIIANNQSPSVGSIQGSIFVTHDNLLGFGDRLALEYGRTEGLDLYNFSYSLPFLPRNGTLNLSYNNNDSNIIENSFQDLGIRSETETFSVGLRQPLVLSPQTEFTVGVALDIRRSQTFILNDIPFSFSEGPEDGKSRVTVIRFYQDWVNRSATQVLAARSQFNFGIGAFDATINDIGTDGRFFSWLGQFQWVQQLSDRTLLLTRINTQLTPDSLLSIERFSIGGVDTVRGYRQNQLVSDNGVLASVELRIPVTANPRTLQITPFFEIGGGWNNRDSNSDPNLIAGLGLGAEWQVSNGLNVRLDYGIPLIGVSNRGDSLQDNGLYFSLRYQPF